MSTKNKRYRLAREEYYRRRREEKNLLVRFAHYVRNRRERQGTTFRVLAGRAEMAHSNIFQVERAKKDLHLTELLKLARAFNESLWQFLTPFLRDHDEALDAPAASGQRKEFFTEIKIPKGQTPKVNEHHEADTEGGIDTELLEQECDRSEIATEDEFSEKYED